MPFYKRPTLANQALYNITKELCSGGLLVGEGTKYPCTQEDLDGYRRFPPGAYYFKPMSPNAGIRRLLDFLDPYREPTPEARSALRRLEAGINMKYKAPDIVIRAFRDLDAAFFGGHLIGNVLVHWKGERGIHYHIGAAGVVGTWGYTRKEATGRASISLNSELLLKYPVPGTPHDPFEMLWETMLHEMTHAYEVICCGDVVDENHGSFFRTCIHAVDQRALRYLGIRAVSPQEERYGFVQ